MIDKPRLRQIARFWDVCTKCPIGLIARKHVHCRVVGPGSTCDVCFVGEAPGVNEDVKGLPFIGDAGKLFDDAIDEARLNVTLPLYEEGDSVEKCVSRVMTHAFVNLVACRPCDRKGGPNRQPSGSEINNCQDHLKQLVEALDPRIVVLTGKVAQNNAPFFPERETRRIPHPAYIIYRGGRSSEDYKRYVDRLTEIFEFAWELKEESRCQ